MSEVRCIVVVCLDESEANLLAIEVMAENGETRSVDEGISYTNADSVSKI